MENNKPRLSLDEQIQHLKDKGILFNIMDEESAKQYLKYNNNYYKLTSFRKNYDKHPGGKNEGKYINLEFAYLVDVSIIDMRLRYRVVEMALDIEHHTKLQLLRKIDEYVEQVLYYSRLDSFSKDYFIQSHSLKKMVQQSVKQSADYFIQKNIHFSLEGDDHLVLTDEKWLQFILNQLLSNALKYTDTRGDITISLSKNERGVWLTLADTGIGIPREDLGRIFDKGFTGKNGRNEETNSTGLGLFLAKSLAEKLGHHLYVESTLGEGTSFQLLFPNLTYFSEENEDFMLHKKSY